MGTGSTTVSDARATAVEVKVLTYKPAPASLTYVLASGPAVFTCACHAMQEEEAKELVNAIVENNGLELLVQRLVQLDENVPEEAAAVFNALGIVENMIDVKPEVRAGVASRVLQSRRGWPLAKSKRHINIFSRSFCDCLSWRD